MGSRKHFSSQLYQKFDLVFLLAHGRALYNGPGCFRPTEHFAAVASGTVPPYQPGYNVAEYLLEVANDPPVSLFTQPSSMTVAKSAADPREFEGALEKPSTKSRMSLWSSLHPGYATTFFTQLQYLCGREWKTLKRDKTLFLTHVIVATLLGIFCGEFLYLLSFLNVSENLVRWSLLPHWRNHCRVPVSSRMFILPCKPGFSYLNC